MIKYIELNIEEAENFLKSLKTDKFLVAIKNLENENDDIQKFCKKIKSDCLKTIRESETIAKSFGEITDCLNVFSESQDLKNIQPKGILSIILVNKEE